MRAVQEIRELRDVICLELINTPEAYAETVDTYRLRYHSGGCEVEGYLAMPKHIEGQIPAIIFNRGGNREFGALQPIWVSRFASYGYISLGSQYRGNCGGTGWEEFGGADVDDVIKLIDIALELSFVRKEGVYMSGHSRGGMMTYLACARDRRIKAATIGAGLADCFIMYDRFDGKEYDMRQDMNELIGGSPRELPEEYVKRSAVCWADKIIPPVLIFQGTDDWRVTPGQAHAMDRALTAAGKEHKLVIFEGADHSLKGTTYIDDVIAWFRAHPLA